MFLPQKLQGQIVLFVTLEICVCAYAVEEINKTLRMIDGVTSITVSVKLLTLI